jgi:hypothetical protein
MAKNQKQKNGIVHLNVSLPRNAVFKAILI